MEISRLLHGEPVVVGVERSQVCLMYGPGPRFWDPHRMTEGISDDPVRAAEYGMRNLRYASENLMEWVLESGDDFYELETSHLQLLTQWNRYAEHAAAAVGGSWTHHKRFGEEGWVYTPVEREYQVQAMRFIDEHILSTPDWALQLDQLRRLEHVGAVERIRAFPELAVQRLLNHARLARMIEHEAFHGDETYRPAEMLDDARAMICSESQHGEPTQHPETPKPPAPSDSNFSLEPGVPGTDVESKGPAARRRRGLPSSSVRADEPGPSIGPVS